MRRPEPLDRLDLPARQDPGRDRVDAEDPGDARGGARVVARHHRDDEAAAIQGRHHRAGARLHRIGHRQDGGMPSVEGEVDRAPALLGQPLGVGGESGSCTTPSRSR